MGASLTVFDAAFRADHVQDRELGGGACTDKKGPEWHLVSLDVTYDELVTLISNIEVKLWSVLAATLNYQSKRNKSLFAKIKSQAKSEFAEKVQSVCRSLLQQFQIKFAPAITAEDATTREENVETRIKRIQSTGVDDPSLMPSLKQCFIRRARAQQPASAKQNAADESRTKVTRRNPAPANYVYIPQDVCSIFFDLLKTAKADFTFFARTSNLSSANIISVPYIPYGDLILLGSTTFVQIKLLLMQVTSHMCLGQDTVESYVQGAQKQLDDIKIVLDEMQGCASCLDFSKVERQMIGAKLNEVKSKKQQL